MEYGKFASAEELLKGYNELEKSFTQKCQELATVKQQGVTASIKDGTSAEASPSQTETAPSTTVDIADTVPPSPENSDGSAQVSAPTETEVQQYLKDHPDVIQKILQQNSAEFAPDVMSGGGNVSLALPSKPKTIKEASVLARELFK